jgi:hypothetical protein
MYPINKYLNFLPERGGNGGETLRAAIHRLLAARPLAGAHRRAGLDEIPAEKTKENLVRLSLYTVHRLLAARPLAGAHRRAGLYEIPAEKQTKIS